MSALPTRRRPRVLLDTSPGLRPGLKDHVERPRKRPPNPRKPAVAIDADSQLLRPSRIKARDFGVFRVGY
jgi:hypothetical protein